MTSDKGESSSGKKKLPTPLVVSPEPTDMITSDRIASPKGETRQRLLRIIQQLLPGAIARARAGTISPILDDSDNDSDEPGKAKVIADVGPKRKHEEHDTKSIASTTAPQKAKRARNVQVRKISSTGGLIVCHNCEEEGHVKPACPNPLRTCRGCRKKGHMIKFCKSTNNPSYRPYKAKTVAPKT